MSRASRQQRIDAAERWPALQQFIGATFNQDWPDDHRTVHDSLAAAIIECPLDFRQQVAREWWNCNATAGAVGDNRKLVHALGAYVHFPKPVDSRNFMNAVYDRLIESIRREVGREWRP